jgi:hypothetical protein
METFIDQLISTGPVGIVCAAAVYVIITLQRNATKKSRDEDRDSMDKRVALIESEIQELKGLDLSTKLAQIQTDISWIKMKLMGKK